MSPDLPTSYYAATAPAAPPRPALAGARRCQVCVVGAGYTGLSAALHLAGRGHDVVVLEARQVGWGASGRNGGQFLSGYSAEMCDVAAGYGREAARRLWDLAEEAKALLRDIIARHDIDCQLKSGSLFAALRPRQMRRLTEEAGLWQRLGYDKARLVSAEALRRLVDSPRYLGGLYDSGGGHLHPLRLARGLADAAEAAGAVIHEASPVVAIDDGLVRLEAATVRADQVVLAGDAYLARIAPALARQVLPVTAHMVATAPLGAALARRLIPGDVAVADCNTVLDYFRLSADHRLLFGGGAGYLGRPRRDAAAMLARRIARVFPQLGPPAIEYCWNGQVAITRDRLPALGRTATGAWYAHGYSGHGVALAVLAGALLAEAVAGTTARFEVFARLHHGSFPGGPVRGPLRALAVAWHRLGDLL